MSKKLGIYIHIPFCKQKCLYCDFVSFANMEKLQDRYFKAIKKEMQYWKQQNEDKQISSIYIGGGTPSYVDSDNIKKILRFLYANDVEYKIMNAKNMENNTILQEDKKDKDEIILKSELIENSDPIEITIEINPGAVTKDKLQDYKDIGINRLSIGLQSTKEELLREIGRIHNFNDFLQTYKMAREIGFRNINIDLMIGLPNQTIGDIKETLQKVINLNPEHISVYSLIIEENTPIQKFIENGKIQLPEEEIERNMYWFVKNFLELNGYKHYEISNFAKEGCESKHNLDCWNQNEYRGFGVAAHSYIQGIRFCNTSSIEKYISNIEEQMFENNIIVQEKQSKEDMMKEYMLLGLRKIDGVSISKFEEKYNENPIMLFKENLEKLVNEDLIFIDGDVIKLSNKGLDLANLVWEEFV